MLMGQRLIITRANMSLEINRKTKFQLIIETYCRFNEWLRDGLSLSVCTNRIVMYIQNNKTKSDCGNVAAFRAFFTENFVFVLSKTGLLVTKLAVLNAYN